MKKLFYSSSFAIILLLGANCQVSYPPPPALLTDIPLRPHRHEVKVFLEGERPENQDYYKVVGLDIPAGLGNFNAIIRAFKLQGQRAGVDAIVLVSSAMQPPYVMPYGFIHGIGIKYRDSLTYISEYVERKDVYRHGSDGSTSLVYQAHFNLLGEELPNKENRSDTLYRRYVQRYALDYLLHETRYWTFSMDASGNIVQRTKYVAPHIPELKCKFQYDHFANVSAIKLYAYANAYQKQPITEELVLGYDGKSRVKEKRAYDSTKTLRYKEELTYDAVGRLIRTHLYAVRSGMKDPIITTLYHYFDPQDLPPITKGL